MRDPNTASPDDDRDPGIRQLRGSLDATGLRFGIVVARFNSDITESLLAGAIDEFTARGANRDDLEAMRVPGAWELVPGCARFLALARVDAVVNLGCVIRGDTPHFEYVAGQATRGLGDLARSADVPVVFGVLTTDTIEQALERAGPGVGNKGREAALAAIEMANLFRSLK